MFWINCILLVYTCAIMGYLGGLVDHYRGVGQIGNMLMVSLILIAIMFLFSRWFSYFFK